MTSLSFPSSPFVGQIVGRYRWDGTAWISRPLRLGGAALLNVGTGPGTVAAGDDSRVLAAAAHTALTSGVHGVTRQLVAFSAATPSLIPGNLYPISTQIGDLVRFIGGNATLTRTGSAGADGSAEIVGTATTTGAVASVRVASDALSRAAVAASVSHTATHRFRASRLGVPYRAVIDWYDGAGTYISSSLGALTVTPTTAVHHTIVCTAEAPAGAAFARSQVSFANAADCVAGDTIGVSVSSCRTSATTPGSWGVSVPWFTFSTASACARVNALGELEVLAGVATDVVRFEFTPVIGRFYRVTSDVFGSAAGVASMLNRIFQGGTYYTAQPKGGLLAAGEYLTFVASMSARSAASSLLMYGVGSSDAGKVFAVRPFLFEEFAL